MVLSTRPYAAGLHNAQTLGMSAARTQLNSIGQCLSMLLELTWGGLWMLALALISLLVHPSKDVYGPAIEQEASYVFCICTVTYCVLRFAFCMLEVSCPLFQWSGVEELVKRCVFHFRDAMRLPSRLIQHTIRSNELSSSQGCCVALMCTAHLRAWRCFPANTCRCCSSAFSIYAAYCGHQSYTTGSSEYYRSLTCLGCTGMHNNWNSTATRKHWCFPGTSAHPQPLKC